MLVTNALSPWFSSSTRSRGDEYAQQGRVTIFSGDGRSIDATVRGSMPYDAVVIRDDAHDRVRFRAWCSCPFASGEGVPCKHLWATLRAADRSGYLQDGRPLDGMPVELELVDDEMDLEPLDGEIATGPGAIEPSATQSRLEQYWASRRLATQPSRTPPLPRPRPAPPSPGTRFLAEIEATLDTRDTAPPFRYAAGELMYVIDLDAVRLGRPLTLEFLYRQKKKSGNWSVAKAAMLSEADLLQLPGAERAALAPLFGASRSFGGSGFFYTPGGAGGSGSFRLTALLVPLVLPPLSRAGRLFLRPRSYGDEFLRLSWDDGPPWRLTPRITRTATGYQVEPIVARNGTVMAADDVMLILEPAFIVTRDRIAPLEVDGGLPLAAPFVRREIVSIGSTDAPALARVLARSGAAPDDLPDELRVEQVDVAPRPRLAVSAHGPSRLRAALSFDYDGSIVSSGSTARAIHFDASRGRMIRRRADEERAALDRLTSLGAGTGYDPYDRAPALELAASRFPAIARALLAEGWHVTAEGRVVHTPSAMRMSVSSGIDWFDLDGDVAFGETSVSLAALLEAARSASGFVRIGDGAVGLLPEDWLARYGPLAAAGEEHDGRLRFSRTQAALLDALLADREAEAAIAVDRVFEQVRGELRRFTQPEPADAPPGFAGTLREYQREGLGWFAFLRRYGFGGCLADDMGLGKTVMVLALLLWWKQEHARTGEGRRPSVVVVPRSLVHNWRAEAARFAPALEVLDFSGLARGGVAGAMQSSDVVLVTYGTLRRDAARLKDEAFEYVILDEAQAIKNASTVSAKAVRLLNGRFRLALSGTPIENHLGELWSVFDFLNPGVLGASAHFARAAAAAGGHGESLALLSRGLRPFILRRTKAQVARELPARTEQTIACDLSAPERGLYDELRRHYRASVLDRVDRVGLAKTRMHVLEALLRLRQAACHPGLVDRSRRDEASAKLAVLVPRLQEVVDEGHKALVFSQFTTLLGLLRTRLDEAGVRYEYLDGRTRDRAPKIERFQQDPSCGVFLISLKAGGVGLNLTAAEYVFLLDPWWNPAVEAQAIDRTHRIGQTREVFAFRLIARGTIEEKVLELQQRKRALADAVLGADGVGLRRITREDLELLLS